MLCREKKNPPRLHVVCCYYNVVCFYYVACTCYLLVCSIKHVAQRHRLASCVLRYVIASPPTVNFFCVLQYSSDRVQVDADGCRVAWGNKRTNIHKQKENREALEMKISNLSKLHVKTKKEVPVFPYSTEDCIC